jgi:cytochrome c oxidase subunit IV
MDRYLPEDGRKKIEMMDNINQIVKIVTRDKRLSLFLGIWKVIFILSIVIFLPDYLFDEGFVWDKKSIEFWASFILIPMLGWTLFSGIILISNGLSKVPFDSE